MHKLAISIHRRNNYPIEILVKRNVYISNEICDINTLLILQIMQIANLI